MESSGHSPYIALCEAIIKQAERDFQNRNRKGREYAHWGRDAEAFLKSDWCEELQDAVNRWYHRNNDVSYVSYLMD